MVMFHGVFGAGWWWFCLCICSKPWLRLSFVNGSFVASYRRRSHGLSSVLSHRCLAPRLRLQRLASSLKDDDTEQQVLVKGGGFPTSTSPVVYDFCHKVQEAVTSEPPQLVSLVLQGSSRSKDTELQHQQRGSIRQVQGRLITVSANSKKKAETMLQLTFKYHGATDICKNIPIQIDPQAKKNPAIAQTLMAIFYPFHFSSQQEQTTTLSKSAPSYSQLLLFQEEISSEWGLWSHDVGTNNPWALQSAHLTLTNGTCWNLRLGLKSAPRLEKVKVKESKPSTTANAKTSGDPSSQQQQQAHDRVKSVLIASSASFLQALGVTNEQGQPKNGIMASKLRQCQKFVEITSRLITTALDQQQRTDGTRATTSPTIISTTDMGCGRGYLTFALHSYLMQQYGTSRDDVENEVNDTIEQQPLPEFRINTKGIDVRPKLVQEISQIAQSLGPNFEGLTFETGSIDSDSSTSVGVNGDSSVLKVLIALHACDTATDDALWWGISRQVNVIVVAPCCHKQVRPQLNQFVRQLQQQQQRQQQEKFSTPEPLLEILRHGIYRERMAETLTDSMRALLLELANYQVQVFEFIGGEDTSKNVMITAVQRSQPRTKAEVQQLQRRLQSMVASYGIGQQQLAMKMGIQLGEDQSSQESATNIGMMSRRRAIPTINKKTESPPP